MPTTEPTVLMAQLFVFSFFFGCFLSSSPDVSGFRDTLNHVSEKHLMFYEVNSILMLFKNQNFSTKQRA